MKLVQAILEGEKVRRSSWPEGVFVQCSSDHSIGSGPLSLHDTDDSSLEPRGVRRRLTLVGADPEGRVYPRKDLGHGLHRPEQPCRRFTIPEWQPPLPDLLAVDWIAL